ncbi:MAG: acetylornithine aminotransferase/acetylornithine/N-succinyldiaminopimelate aminotransferase [Verrucomicrobia bacterium]|nr:MAG: acetylornithine aminotransferase/acetylornithine/N-succinyldiaminopimelate aminotransferase [Verrucomicrobiota bacterium]
MSLSPSTLELFDQYVIPTYGRFAVRLARGSGCRVWDEDGREYLDFGAGIAVSSLGHCHPRVVERMRQQLGELVHTSNLYYTRPQGELAKRLVDIVGAPGKIFFCNSGAEANEALYKLSRKFGNEANGFARTSGGTATGGTANPDAPLRRGIITMNGSFHGRTLGGIAATGQDKVKKGFEPMVEGFTHIPFNDCDSLNDAVDAPGTVAVMLEPVQGEGGIYPVSAEYLRTARALCDRRSTLLLFDEVQCGLGRTGDWNGWDTLAPDVKPDAVSWAKGIAGGFPLGAIWVSSRPVQMRSGEVKPLCDLLGPGSHGTTFGGTPLICAGALEVLSIIEDERLLENARNQGRHAVEALRALQSPWIREVRGVGLMLGIELAADFGSRCALPAGKAPSIYMVERLHEAGLLTIPSGTHILRWLPPLNVQTTEVEEAVRILSSVLASLPCH